MVKVCKDIKGKYKVKATWINRNFKDSLKKDFFEGIIRKLDEYEISILVNNVGIGCLSNFSDLKFKRIRDIMVINCFP